jgi:hypothetical protein
MIFDINLRSYFTRDAVAEALRVLPPVKSPITDLIFATKKQHPLPVIGLEELSEITKNVPVVKRGAPSLSLGGNTLNISYIEPQGVDVNEIVTARDLNDLKMLDKSGMSAWVNNKIDKIRRVIRQTTETLACLALTGTITYPCKTEGGYEDYVVDYGSTLTFSPDLVWDDNTATLKDVLKTLIEIQSVIQETSQFGGSVVFLAGKTAFFTLANLITSLPNDARIPATVSENTINLAGFKVILANYQYWDLATSAYLPVIDPKYICAVAQDAPNSLYYLAIDDIKAGMQATPLYINTIQQDDPSSYKIIGKSKPLPIVVPKAICWSQVIA